MQSPDAQITLHAGKFQSDNLSPQTCTWALMPLALTTWRCTTWSSTTGRMAWILSRWERAWLMLLLFGN